MFGEKNTNWGEDTIEDKNEGKQNERVGGRKEENKSQMTQNVKTKLSNTPETFQQRR